MRSFLERIGQQPRWVGINYDLGEGYRPVQSAVPVQAPMAEPEPVAVDVNEFLTAQEAAGILDVRVRTVIGMRERGRLPSHRLGKRWFYLRGDVERLRGGS